MVRSKVNVDSIRYQSYLQEQRLAVAQYVTTEMTETKEDVLQRLAKALSLPLTNR